MNFQRPNHPPSNRPTIEGIVGSGLFVSALVPLPTVDFYPLSSCFSSRCLNVIPKLVNGTNFTQEEMMMGGQVVGRDREGVGTIASELGLFEAINKIHGFIKDFKNLLKQIVGDWRRVFLTVANSRVRPIASAVCTAAVVAAVVVKAGRTVHQLFSQSDRALLSIIRCPSSLQ